jgi:hypothetical protein
LVSIPDIRLLFSKSAKRDTKSTMATHEGGPASLRDYGIAAPHGPNMTGNHVATQDIDIRHDMSENEQSIFHALLHPDDMYDANGTYWADMPLGQRVKFVAAVDAKETKEEASYFWQMFKNDPLEPMRHYFRTCVVPGAGLGLEGSVALAPHLAQLLIFA